MKVVMVNDCAFVGETLSKYFPTDIEVDHFKRTRGFLNKTLGIAWKIFRSRGNIYHVHYLLQDCYIAAKLKKRPLIGHAHGSDVRDSLRHFAWGRIVKHNLLNCDLILLATPNLLPKARLHAKKSEYMPNPVDTNIFHPLKKRKSKSKLRVLVAGGSDWKIKRTDRILYALKRIEDEVDISIISYGIDSIRTLKLAKKLNLKIRVLPPVPHNEMPKYYWDTDTVIASIGIGGTLGMVALEAIACGRPTVTHASSKFAEYKTFPLLDVDTPKRITSAILSSRHKELWEKEYEYLMMHHSPEKIAQKLVEIYRNLANPT